MTKQEKRKVLISLAMSFEDIKDFNLQADREAIDEIVDHVTDNLTQTLEQL